MLTRRAYTSALLVTRDRRAALAAVTPDPPRAVDERWPAICAALTALRATRRRSVRIVDVDCGTGTLLIEAVRHARKLGFTAIEGRGIDGVPVLIARATAAAAALRDPAIGLRFEVADLRAVLDEESEFPADIVLCRDGARSGHREAIAPALAAAGRVVVGTVAERHAR